MIMSWGKEMRRLGLDIGTNSIGWCLTEDDSILAIGSRIFSDGRDPQSGTSLASTGAMHGRRGDGGIGISGGDRHSWTRWSRMA